MAEDSSCEKDVVLSSDQALSSVNSFMNQACAILKEEVRRVHKEKEALDYVAKKMNYVHFAKTIKLNVGGQHFTTSLETLTKDAGSMLNAMFSGIFDTKPDEDGSYFIDRDGTHFRYILNYLRTGKLVLPEDDTIRNEVLVEAEFYQVQGIIGELQTPKMFKDSIILSEEQRQVLECWMEKEFKFKFVLLFRASRDGWASSKFHSHCDNKGVTITIVKSGNNIFGGYADVSWNSSDDYTECTKSFLFSLANPAGIGPTKMALKAKRKVYGIYCDSGSGPIFGAGHDLCISNIANTDTSSYSSQNHTYEFPTNQGITFFTGDKHFSVNEYEVFGYQEG